MNAKVVCYDESKPAWAMGSKKMPLGLLHSFYLFNEARESGKAITFVAEGPDAGRAMDVVKAMLERPTNPAEAFLEMVAGRPVRFPSADQSLEQRTREILRGWGMESAFDEMRRRKGA